MRPAAIQGGDERRDLFVDRHRSEPTEPYVYRLVALAFGHSSSPSPLLTRLSFLTLFSELPG